jgi:hypothetical protein
MGGRQGIGGEHLQPRAMGSAGAGAGWLATRAGISIQAATSNDRCVVQLQLRMLLLLTAAAATHHRNQR